MENAQKAIMIGVGLFITIIVIAAVMLITGLGQDMLNKGTDQTTAISSSLQAQITSDYDGNTNLTGSQVVAAVKRFYQSERLAVVVVNGADIKNYGTWICAVPSAATPVAVARAAGTKADPVGSLASSNLASYVIPSARYTSKLIYSTTGNAVTGIIFTMNP